MASNSVAYDFDGHHVAFTPWDSDMCGELVAASVKCDGCQWGFHTGAYAGELTLDGARALVGICCELNEPEVIR